MSEITPNTANPVREDEYYEALAAKLGIPASAIPRTPVWRNEEELAALVFHEHARRLLRRRGAGGAY